MSIMQQALKMDSLIASHSAVMDKYDPEKRVALYVDEWSNWYDVEPGTNPGFLHQQNTLRDAVTTARHADGTIVVSLVNLDPHRPAHVAVSLAEAEVKSVTGTFLSADAMDAHNSFERPDAVKPAVFTGATLQGGALSMDLPAKSVVASRCDRPRS